MSVGDVRSLATTGTSSTELPQELQSPMEGRSRQHSVQWDPHSSAEEMSSGLDDSVLKEHVQAKPLRERSTSSAELSGGETTLSELRHRGESSAPVYVADPLANLHAEDHISDHSESEDFGMQTHFEDPEELGFDQVDPRKSLDDLHEVRQAPLENEARLEPPPEERLQDAARNAGNRDAFKGRWSRFCNKVACMFHKCSWKEASLATKWQLRPDDVHALKQLGIKINSRSVPADFHPTNMRGGAIDFASGQVSSVKIATFGKGEGTQRVVLKMDESYVKADPATDSGIPQKNPKLAVRNLATSLLDQKLKLGVIPKTGLTVTGPPNAPTLTIAMEFAGGAAAKSFAATPLNEQALAQMTADLKSLGGDEYKFNPETLAIQDKSAKLTAMREELFANHPDGTEGAQLLWENAVTSVLGQELGLSMNVAQSAQVKFQNGAWSVLIPKYVELNFQDPKLRQGLVKLQLLDALCGQVDRHPGNYIVELDAEGNCIGVKGIDNDFSFGKLLRTIAETMPRGFGTNQLKGIGLPPIIDEDMYVAFMSLTDQDIDDALHGLSKVEIQATKDRLQEIKDHCVKLATEGRMIGNYDWDEPTTADMLSGGPENSYVKRDQELLQNAANNQQTMTYDEAVGG